MFEHKVFRFKGYNDEMFFSYQVELVGQGWEIVAVTVTGFVADRGGLKMNSATIVCKRWKEVEVKKAKPAEPEKADVKAPPFVVEREKRSWWDQLWNG